MKNGPATVEHMREVTFMLLQYWLLDKYQESGENKEKTYEYFMTLSPQERVLVIRGLREVISGSQNEEFKKASEDIPAYIKSRL